MSPNPEFTVKPGIGGNPSNMSHDIPLYYVTTHSHKYDGGIEIKV